MIFNGTLFEHGIDIVNLFHQGDGDSDITGDWLSLENYQEAYVLLVKGGSEDVDDLGIEFQQATDSSGTSAKAFETKEVWYKSGAFTGVATWTDAGITTADDKFGFGSSLPTGFTRIAADVNTGALQALFRLRAEHLDVNGGFKFFTAFVEGDNVNNAALLSAWAILVGSRYPQQIPLSCLS